LSSSFGACVPKNILRPFRIRPHQGIHHFTPFCSIYNHFKNFSPRVAPDDSTQKTLKIRGLTEKPAHWAGFSG
jgi:hypothetical protein